jgi:3-ketosteroid 9alpha-monooxygenase subunit A
MCIPAASSRRAYHASAMICIRVAARNHAQGAALLRLAFICLGTASTFGNHQFSKDTFVAIPDNAVTLDQVPGAVGFPHKGMPTSWFQVGWSDSLKVSDVRPLKYFNKDLVLYRTEDGVAHLADAFCPHLGAHLGYGGRVEGCEMVCPYHGWRWNSDGSNALAPSEGRASSTRRIMKQWEVVESNGIIWTWHDALGRAPLWSAPEERRQEDDFLPVYPACTFVWENVRIRPQYPAENTVDLDHLIFVHRNGLLPVTDRKPEQLPEFIEEGHLWYNKRPLPMHSSSCIGIGLVMVDFPFDETRPHRMPAILYNATTPIDDENSDYYTTILVRQDMSAEGCEGDLPVGNALKRIQEQEKQAGRDRPIWEHMVYVERPAYTRSEGGPFLKLRRWAKQFYPENDTVESKSAPVRDPATVA